jgi:hypothetical protein
MTIAVQIQKQVGDFQGCRHVTVAAGWAGSLGDALIAVTTQTMPLYGVVDNISKLKTQGFGFLKPEDGGKTIYFHING